MALLLRMVRESRWRMDENGNIDLLEAIRDLKTAGQGISVWHAEDDRSNLSRIIAALAASAPYLRDAEYMLFDRILLAELDLQCCKTQGATLDRTANEEWHEDIMISSEKDRLRLADVLYRNGSIAIIIKKQIKRLVAHSVVHGWIPFSELSDTIQQQIIQELRELGSPISN
ncbi:MAG: hypothetical protein IT210_18135 [Armatimonadetes bacterium]|nr:hypothetical protein [Armatimonadota bacterium]